MQQFIFFICLFQAPIYPFIPCQANTCSNNGDCFSLSGQAYCVCNDGWTGERCDVPLPSGKRFNP